MTEDVARIAAFEALFDDVTDASPPAPLYTIVWSGALGDDPKAEAPALFTSPKLAWEFWSRAAAEYVTSAFADADAGTQQRRLHWRTKPVLWKYQMTLTDMGQRQRLVSDRYAVYSVLAVSTYVAAPAEDDHAKDDDA